MSLSASGTLSALAGAITETQVGTYTFRLKVIDAALDEDVYDYTLEILPFQFNRVPSFLLDPNMRELMSRWLLEGTNRRETERHFFRPEIGISGDTFAHLDRDIMGPDWKTPGNDVDLRTILDEIFTLGNTSIKSINSVLGDPVTRDFLLNAGVGISISPVPGGLDLSATSPGAAIDLTEQTAPVTPGNQLNIVLTTSSYMGQLWLESDGDYYQAGNIPDYAGKKLKNSIAAAMNGYIGMAVGQNAGGPVVHVCWDDGATVELARFDGLTLALQQRVSIGGSPIVGYPTVLVTTDDKVVVAFVDGTATMLYGVLNADDYTDTTSPAYLNPPVPIPPPGIVPNSAGKMPGAVSPLPAEAYIAADYGAGFAVGYFDTATPGATGGFINFFSGPGGAGSGGILDITVDSANNRGYVAEVDQPGAGAVLELWWFDMPYTTVGVAPVTIAGPTTGAYFLDGMGMVDTSDASGPALAYAFVYLFEDTSAVPTLTEMYHVWVDQVDVTPWTVPPPVVTSPVATTRSEGFNKNAYAFTRWWADPIGDANHSQVVYAESTASPMDGDISRFVFDVNVRVIEAETLVFDFSETSTVVPAFTSEMATSGQALRIFTSQDIFGALEPQLTSENVNMQFELSSKTLSALNNSPFTWTMKLVALEESAFNAPPSLLIACWQLSQGLQDFWNANAYYPSPSDSGVSGVNWTESELATTETPAPGGPRFDAYYTVTPGQYDLSGGSIAQGTYAALQAAASASHQTFAFRYNSYPSEIIAAETVIGADITANLPLPTGGGANPDFLTLAELDVILSSTYATTYSGLPYDFYEYFCFVDTTGNVVESGWYSKNYVINAQAYGPASAGVGTIPVVEHFTQAVPAVAGVPTDFTLAQSVVAAQVFVNGVQYYQGIDWVYNGQNVIRYLNNPAEFVLTAGSRISVWKYTQ